MEEFTSAPAQSTLLSDTVPRSVSETQPAMVNTLRERTFQHLIGNVQTCHLCPRMEGRLRVLGSANGSLHADTLFVAEAPGRLGADKSGIPLMGDQTGRNFDILLDAAQLDRESVFITNAVLCNPRNEKGNNTRPTTLEIENCSCHLRKLLMILQPHYVVTLGQVALSALQNITKHDVVLAQHVGTPQRWNGRWLIALYHPGPRARIHRSLALQMEDFRRLGNFVRDSDNLVK